MPTSSRLRRQIIQAREKRDKRIPTKYHIPWPSRHLEVAVGVAAIVISLLSAFYIFYRTEEVTNPSIEARFIYWYGVTGDFDTADGTRHKGSGSPIAVLTVTNTGRTGVTIGGVEQIDQGGARHALIGTVVIPDIAKPQPVNKPVFGLDAGQSVFIVVPLYSTEYWGGRDEALVLQTLDRTHTEVRVTLTDEPSGPGEGETTNHACALQDNATLCFAAAKLMPELLENPSFPTAYWLCTSKYEGLNDIPSTEQRDFCRKWYTDQRWPQP